MHEPLRRYTDTQHDTRVYSESWGDQIHLTLHTRRRYGFIGPYRLVQRFGAFEHVSWHWTWKAAYMWFEAAVANADCLVAVIQNGLPIPVSYPYNHG